VGGVDHVDAGIEGAADDRDAVGLVGVAGLPQAPNIMAPRVAG